MHILITGAAQGIGAAIATALANPNNSLTVVDLKADALSTCASQLQTTGATIHQLAGDLTDASFLNQIKEHLNNNPLDVLINNAGVAHPLKPFEQLTEAEFDLGFKVNVKAPFQLIQTVLPAMQQRGSGQIINIASRSNIYGYPHMGIYASTKAAITSFSGTVALENPELKALTIIPGRTNTQMQKSLRGEEEASGAQSPEYVGQTVAKVVSGEIEVKSGEFVLIDFGEHRVLYELDEADLHRRMH